MPAVIATCTCSHEDQDKRYGKGRRVMNEVERKEGRAAEARCTVCGKVQGYDRP